MKKLIILVSMCLLLGSANIIANEEYYPSPKSTDSEVNRVEPTFKDDSGDSVTIPNYSYNTSTRTAVITYTKDDGSTGTEKYEIVYTPYEVVDEMEVSKIESLLKDSHADVYSNTEEKLKSGIQEEINYFSEVVKDKGYDNKTPSDLLVLHVFDVSVLKFKVDVTNRTDTTREYISLEDYFKIIEQKTGVKPTTFTMSIKTALPKDFILVHDKSTLAYPDGTTNVAGWEVVKEASRADADPKNCYTYSNGVLTITTTSLSCYAIFGVSTGSIDSDIYVPYTGVE